MQSVMDLDDSQLLQDFLQDFDFDELFAEDDVHGIDMAVEDASSHDQPGARTS
jgi:hypothetical protein